MVTFARLEVLSNILYITHVYREIDDTTLLKATIM